MLIHRQNSYAPRGKQLTGRREAQSREPVNRVKKNSLYLHRTFLSYGCLHKVWGNPIRDSTSTCIKSYWRAETAIQYSDILNNSW
jgi:hypothetical protein